jgi:cytochrome c
MRPRFLAVGFFLSTLLVSSDLLIEHMKKVWRIRGNAEANQIKAEEGCKFIIDFSEEGDLQHAVRGGPWQYKLDAFLVEPMEAGIDPTSVLFTHIPMWVQFRGIPFYLLTKQLAWALGEEVSTTVMIDNNSCGNMDEKFLRTRVQLPLYAALRKYVTLQDEITGEQVNVQICYERLPNFCLFCGYIGHMEARCDLPVADRRINFSMDMRVQPVHFADPRAWYLPEAMGMAQAQPAPIALWRASKPSPATTQQGTIEEVADKVAKLRVADTNIDPSDAIANKHDDTPPTVVVVGDAAVEAGVITPNPMEHVAEDMEA